MKKNNKVVERHPAETIGVDLGDKMSRYAVVNEEGLSVEEGSFRNSVESIAKHFGKRGQARVALEVGTQSAWIAREFSKLGHEVIVANARELKWITSDTKRSNMHKRPGRRTGGDITASSTEWRIPAGCAGAVANDAEHASRRRWADNAIRGRRQRRSTRRRRARGTDRLGEDRDMILQKSRMEGCVRWDVTRHFVLTLGRKERFAHSRDVGSYLGLRPRQKQSGERDPQLGISKSGDKYLRKLLVQCAHHILGHWGKDSALRQWGLSKSDGSPAKKRAVVAVARKLAVLLHRMWMTGETFKPFPKMV